MVTDPIADFLTRIRNAQMANHRIVEIPASNLKKRMTEILYDKGYILKYKFEDDSKQGVIKIALKYDPATKEPAIKSLERISRPGLRQYSSPAEFKRVKNGLGVAIIFYFQGSHDGQGSQGAECRRRGAVLRLLVVMTSADQIRGLI